jgi:hypothetical protein
MAKAWLDFSSVELSKKKREALEGAIDGCTLEFETRNSDLDLDGEFVDAVRYQSQLWDAIVENVGAKLSGIPDPRKIESNITAPGTYNVEVELSDATVKGKLKIKAPAPTDKSSRQIKKNSKPPHVKVKLRGAKLADCPSRFSEDLKGLVKLMGKTASYEYVGGSGSSKGWSPKFSGHQCHEQPGEGWKAYIDEPTMGTGTTWRLYFTLDFDVDSKTLNVELTNVQEDH